MAVVANNCSRQKITGNPVGVACRKSGFLQRCIVVCRTTDVYASFDGVGSIIVIDDFTGRGIGGIKSEGS